jgi:hypothetical protein
MDARSFRDSVPLAVLRRVVERAGTTVNYFDQLACGSRRPSPDLAMRLVEASRAYSKRARLDLQALLLPGYRAANVGTAPSAGRKRGIK